ncbi:MAG: hypothetical protein HeimC2_43620 [Candidatus Heimdallarchaeota archaeon LC_2]|nr:MAG: hypothetical protein HeimC2_43620 [Candidatus Heimdallarchaeota archaeon LC_2]
MSSSSSNISGRKRKRGVTRRVKDDKGNIKVIKYQKASSGLRIPGLTWGKIPSLLLGLPLALYSGLIYASKNGNLSEEDSVARRFLDSTSELSAAMKLIVTGTLGMVLSGFLAYALIRKGFKIRKYPAVTREVVAIWATFIVLSAIFSPFINEPGLVRQQSDDEFVPDDRAFDLTGLDSPFYAEFLEGLLDLLGNIPDPKEEVAYITPTDGQPLDYFQDRYLYRWRVAETYDTGLADFEQAYTSTQLDYLDGEANYNSVFTGSNFDEARAFNIAEQYLTISNAYLGDALVPWNSEFGGAITDDFASMDAEVSNNGSLIDGSISGYRDINEQPVLSMSFDSARTQGFVNYDSYWITENKTNIADNSVTMSLLSSTLDGYPTSRFGDLSTANPDEISGIWGLESLPGGSNYFDDTNTGDDDFVTKYNSYKAILDNNPGISVYNFALLLNNDVQNAVVQGLFDGSLNIDPTQTSGVADTGADKAYWFYRALEDPNIQFGMKELLAGFVNMLRSFDIPARPIIGFSVGNFQDSNGNDCTGSSNCDQIEILFEHLHVWIEVMIPVQVGSETTYHWGIFNPVPDPWILQEDSTDFAFGQNALGGAPDIEIEITSGTPTSLLTPITVDPFPTTDTFFTNQMGEDLTGRVRILYDGNPAEGQTVSLRLVNESEMLTGDIDPDIGIEIPAVITDDADGWGDFRIFVNRQGQVFTYDETDTRSLTPVAGTTIVQVDPLENIGDIGLYGIIAIYSLNFNGTLTGWELDANLVLEADVTTSSIVNPNTGGNVDAYGALFGDTLQFTVTVTDDDALPMEGISNVQFLLLNEDDYNTLLASLILQVPIASLITANTLGTFSTTDISGNGTINVTFDQALIDGGKAANEIYVALALIQAGLKYNQIPVFVWFERTMTMDAVLLDTGTPVLDNLSDNGMLDGNPVLWDIEANATGFDNPGNQIFPNEPAEGVQYSYYIIDQTIFDANPSYALLEANNIFSSCQSGAFIVSTCYLIDLSDTNNNVGISIVSGNGITNSAGTATLSLSLQRDGFQDSIFFYFVVVSHDFSSLAVTIKFFATGSPPPPLLLNTFGESEIQLDSPSLDMPSNSYEYTNQIEINVWSLVNILGLLSINSVWNRRR